MSLSLVILTFQYLLWESGERGLGMGLQGRQYLDDI